MPKCSLPFELSNEPFGDTLAPPQDLKPHYGPAEMRKK